MNTKTYLSFFLLLFIGFGILSAQPAPKKPTVEIKVNSVCGMCTSIIESAIKENKGIIYASHDQNTKIVTVKYKSKKITADEIRKAITLAGYNADDMPADPEARKNLDQCCKVPE